MPSWALPWNSFEETVRADYLHKSPHELHGIGFNWQNMGPIKVLLHQQPSSWQPSSLAYRFMALLGMLQSLFLALVYAIWENSWVCGKSPWPTAHDLLKPWAKTAPSNVFIKKIWGVGGFSGKVSYFIFQLIISPEVICTITYKLYPPLRSSAFYSLTTCNSYQPIPQWITTPCTTLVVPVGWEGNAQKWKSTTKLCNLSRDTQWLFLLLDCAWTIMKN